MRSFLLCLLIVLFVVPAVNSGPFQSELIIANNYSADAYYYVFGPNDTQKVLFRGELKAHQIKTITNSWRHEGNFKVKFVITSENRPEEAPKSYDYYYYIDPAKTKKFVLIPSGKPSVSEMPRGFLLIEREKPYDIAL